MALLTSNYTIVIDIIHVQVRQTRIWLYAVLGSRLSINIGV